MKIKLKHILLLGITISLAFAINKTTPLYLETPKAWPKPHYDFSKNPLTEEGFQLGRNLFYVSCPEIAIHKKYPYGKT